MWGETDNGNVYSSNVANAGGNWNNTCNTGAFHLNVNNSPSNANTNIGSHLMSLKLPKIFNIYNGANIPKG